MIKLLNVVVVTHTTGNRLIELDRCKRSVEEQLEKGDSHQVIQTMGLMKARWDSLRLANYIAWVDDDDYIMNDSLRLCKQAIEEHDVGIAFTNESLYEGAVHRAPRFYSDVATTPSAIHHLCLLKTSLIPESVWRDYEQIGMGLEWLIKGYLALKHGAIHVPIDGYHWTQHADQHSKSKEKWIDPYNKVFSQLQKTLVSYAGDRCDSLIPQFVTSS